MSFDLPTIVETIVILLIAITWHELAHALTAQYLGDDTPRRMGHISLNPFRHMDQYGIVLLFLSSFAGLGLPMALRRSTSATCAPTPSWAAVSSPSSARSVTSSWPRCLLSRCASRCSILAPTRNFITSYSLRSCSISSWPSSTSSPSRRSTGGACCKLSSRRATLRSARCRAVRPIAPVRIFIFGSHLGFYNVLYGDFIIPIARLLLGPQFGLTVISLAGMPSPDPSPLAGRARPLPWPFAYPARPDRAARAAGDACLARRGGRPIPALVRGSPTFDLDLTAEFLYVAARLLLLKSLALLPHAADEEPREDVATRTTWKRACWPIGASATPRAPLAARQEAGMRMFPRAISERRRSRCPPRFAVEPYACAARPCAARTRRGPRSAPAPPRRAR